MTALVKLLNRVATSAKEIGKYEVGIDELEGFKKGLKSIRQTGSLDILSEKEFLDFERNFLKYVLFLSQLAAASLFSQSGPTGTKTGIALAVLEAFKYVSDRGLIYAERNQEYLASLIKKYIARKHY